jgi:hypothetical protein
LRFIGAATAAIAGAGVLAVAALGSAPLTRVQYIAKLRAANAASAKADGAAGAAVESKTATLAQVKALFRAMGRTHTAIGKQFAALVPPKAAAKANADFAHAEVVFGEQNEAIAAKLPATKAALLEYIQSLKPPSGGKMLDHAIAELHAAGFRI